MNIQDINMRVKLLDNWLSNNGWAGYDPYDIKSGKLIITLTKLGNANKVWGIIRELVFEFFYTFPVFARKLFRVSPKINAKAMGLFAKAYLDLYSTTKNELFLSKSKECIAWLDNNKSTNCKGYGWGYPFDWQSQKLIPKGTPNGIVTTAVGDSYWAWYKFSNNKEYLNTCENICAFLVSLPIDTIADDKICFSYTPLFKNHVHNLNLFVAEFLIKVGKEVNNEKWIDLGLKATNYTISDQLNDGSFDYNGPPETPNNFIDNYHTGFVLRMLHSIWKLTEKEVVYKSLKKCYAHYVHNFFENETIPKLMPNRKYRVDIHSCAETINCLAELSNTFPDGIKIAKNVAVWTITNLQHKQGYFYYGINKSRIFKNTYTSKIPYIRWAQAWMLKALSNYFMYVR